MVAPVDPSSGQVVDSYVTSIDEARTAGKQLQFVLQSSHMFSHAIGLVRLASKGETSQMTALIPASLANTFCASWIVVTALYLANFISNHIPGSSVFSAFRNRSPNWSVTMIWTFTKNRLETDVS
jgi:hypothetical protein